MLAAEILDHFRRRRDATLAELVELVAIETPSGDAAAVARFVARCRPALEAAGMRVESHDGPNGPAVFAERAGEDPAIVLVAHSDTVWPLGTVVRRPPEVRDGRLFGPGVFDMKGGLELILAVVRFLAEERVALRRRLQVFVSSDEEIGSVSSHRLMDRLLSPASTAIVPEPPCPDGALKIRRKGVGIYRVRVTGREAHAGVEPERGISAVDEIARLVLEVHGWSDRERGVSLNVGAISGGTASNVVAGAARADLDLRFDDTADGADFDARIRALRPAHPEARLEVEGGIIFPPLVPTAKSRELAELTSSLARELGLEVGIGSSGGGSDGSYLASRGLAVIDGVGIDGAGAHAVDEHIVVDRIAPRAALLASLVLALDELSG